MCANMKEINFELGRLHDVILKLKEENKELKEELIEAYLKRGDMYMGGEKESIDERIKELKS
jgi:hypothetical protein